MIACLDLFELLWAGLYGLAFVSLIYLVGRFLEWLIAELRVD